MMRLQLTVRQTEPMPGAREEVRRFERLPVVIGRGGDCDLVLVDESRFISSNHAVISLVEGAPFIRDTSANGVFLNGASHAVGRGNEAPLHERDRIGIGDYVLTVALERPATAGAADAGAAPDFDGDPFAALLDDVPGAAVDASAAAPGPHGTPVPARFDEPYDPFRGGEPGWAEPGNASPSVDADWADWPAASAPPAPPSRPRAASVAGHGSAAPGGGNGTPGGRGAPSSELADALLLQCIDGLMALLRSRSELKQAMRTDVTSLAGVGNNPLKFSRDGRDALSRLRDPDPDGAYLDPATAVGEAIDDLSLHQVAMLEGMKGAVAALLERFDPERLAESLTADHPIASSIPLARDAKLWERFRERYHDIEEAARGDFGALFGREFRKAYEARVRELGREPDLW